MYMILTMMLMLFIMLDPSIYQALGTGMSFLLNPAIGFGGQMPVISVLLAGALTGVLSTGLRHWSSDYIALERGRLLQRTFQKEMNEARVKRDVDRVERLKRAQPQIMSRTMEANFATMKPAVGTMVVAIAVFGWLNVFLLREVHVSAVSLPWATAWPLHASFGFPYWVVLYMVMSLPLTVVLSGVLKLWRYRSFDPAAPLKAMPTVESLIQGAEGAADDEALVRKESERARKRLRAQGGAPARPAAADQDEEEDAALIVEGDEDDVRIVDIEGEGEAPEGADGSEPARGPATAREVGDKDARAAPSEEE